MIQAAALLAGSAAALVAPPPECEMVSSGKTSQNLAVKVVKTVKVAPQEGGSKTVTWLREGFWSRLERQPEPFFLIKNTKKKKKESTSKCKQKIFKKMKTGPNQDAGLDRDEESTRDQRKKRLRKMTKWQKWTKETKKKKKDPRKNSRPSWLGREGASAGADIVRE